AQCTCSCSFAVARTQWPEQRIDSPALAPGNMDTVNSVVEAAGIGCSTRPAGGRTGHPRGPERPQRPATSPEGRRKSTADTAACRRVEPGYKTERLEHKAGRANSPRANRFAKLAVWDRRRE